MNQLALHQAHPEHTPTADLGDGVYTLDSAGRITGANLTAERLLGWQAAEVRGRSIAAIVRPSGAGAASGAPCQALRAGESVRDAVAAFARRDGTCLVATYALSPIVMDGRVSGAVLTFHDRAGRERLLSQLAWQAFRDPLTGLPNQTWLLDRLAAALTHTTGSGTAVGVVLLDLDRFHRVNVGLGRAAGDQVLRVIAGRLAACAGPDVTVARGDGDRFVLLLDHVTSERAVHHCAVGIIEALRAPLRLDRREIITTASAGIALSTARLNRPAALLRAAEIALYRAKADSGACYRLFDAAMATRAMERLALENDLWRAVRRGEFQIAYEPQLELATGRLVGVEALVRWAHPARGLLPPSAFIPLAEESGLISRLGAWVLTNACQQARRWQARYPGAANLVMCVNLSVRQLQEPALLADVARSLDDAGLVPRQLRLELTESALLEEAPRLLGLLRDVRKLGVELAIDDFGTGYSNLSYLKRFPVDMLKIDQAFTAGLGRDPRDTAIVRTIVGLANVLGLRVTAEGIENKEQLTQLRALGCAFGQGYYFARPLPPAGVEALLARTGPPIMPALVGRSEYGIAKIDQTPALAP